MKGAYFLLGSGILLLLGGGWYLTDMYSGSQNQEESEAASTVFGLSSPVFEHNGTIPSLYTCDENRLLNPPLVIENPPEGTQSFALIVDDPDIPQVFKDERGIDAFDHWVVYNIPADTTEIPEGASLGSSGLNGRGEAGYTGPCPPPEYEPTEHRYIFKLYALSGSLNFIQAPTLSEVRQAIDGMIIAETELVGLYDRAQ